MPTHRVVSVDELTQYLHLPEKAVAKQLGICLTSLKKLCRQHGITRWPYRKLKSLDKKIAKAENGTGIGTEDANTLKAKAEELKKEKMAVAFTYGIKEANKDGNMKDGSSPTNMSEASSVPPCDAKENKVAKPKKANVAAVSSPSVLTPTGKSDWPFTIGHDQSEIPTPPDETTEHDADIFAEAVADVMNPMLGENGMNPTEWGEEEDEEDGKEDVGEKTVAKDGKKSKGSKASAKAEKETGGKKKGAGKATPQAVPKSEKKEKTDRKEKGSLKEKVSGADLKLASALALSVTPQRERRNKEKVSEKAVASTRDRRGNDVDVVMESPKEHHDEDQEDHDNAQPKFDIDEHHPLLHSDLMESEFFSALPPHHDPHHDDDGPAHVHIEEDTVHIDIRDDHSPSSRSSGESHSTTVPEVEVCELPAEHHLITGDWGEVDAHSWLSPDTPKNKNLDLLVSMFGLPQSDTGGSKPTLSTNTTSNVGVVLRSASGANSAATSPGTRGSGPGSGSVDLSSVLALNSPSSGVHV